MSQRTRLFRRKDPYDLPASDEQFLRAVRENCAFHYAHCRNTGRCWTASPSGRRTCGSMPTWRNSLPAHTDLQKAPAVLPAPVEDGGGVHLLGHLRPVQRGGL